MIITFRTTVAAGVLEVENQAIAYWDGNGDGVVDSGDDNVRDDTPVSTDNPLTNPNGDPTVVKEPIAVPTLSEWGRIALIAMMFLSASVMLYRREEKTY